MKKWEKVPYVLVFNSMIYDMTCTTPDIAFAIGAVRRHLSNLGKEH